MQGVARVAVVVLLVAAGACTESSPDGASTGPTSEFVLLDPDATTTTAPRRGDVHAAPSPPHETGDGAGAPPPDGGRSGPDGSGGGSGGSSGSNSPPPSGEDLLVDDDARLGAMGPALLLATVPGAVVEIDATPGEGLTSQARNGLRNALLEHGQKQSVEFASGSTLPEQDVYTTEELRSLSRTHRSVTSSEERVALHVMVLSGRHEDSGIVGVAFSATAFAIFTEQLSGGLLGLHYPNYEEAVVVHELGHLFGLVNLTGHGAFHEDPQHPGHSADDDSVMFWAIESTLVGDVFQGGPPRSFNADDEREMDAIRDAA